MVMKRLSAITYSLLKSEGLFLPPILIGCGLSVFLLVTVRFFPIDDAYIFRKYAENLANGYGFAYNPGEIRSGATSFLYVIVLALLQKLTGGWDYTLTTGLLGVALFGGSIYVAGKMVWRETQSKLITMAAAFALAIAPPMFCTAVSGMETILYVFLLLCLVGVVIHWGITKPWLLGVMAALLYLTRPDGVLALALIWFLALPLAADRSSRWTMRDYGFSLLQAMTLFVLVVIPYHLYFWAHTGYLFPTTFYGKMIDMVPELPAMNLDSWVYLTFQAIVVALEGFIAWNPPANLVLLLLFGYNVLETYHLIRSRVWDPEISLGKMTRITFFFALPLAYSFLIFPGRNGFGGYYERYILPVYPFLIIGATLGVHQAASLARHLFSAVPSAENTLMPFLLNIKKVFRIGVVICPWTIYLLVLLLLIKGIPTHMNIYQGLALEKNRLRYNVAMWLRDNTPQDARVAIGAPGLGVVGYYADRYILDLGALIDPDIFPYYQAVAQGANKWDKIMEYMRDKRATYLVHEPTLSGYPYLHLLTIIDTPAEAGKWGLKEQGVYLFQP